MTFGEEWAKDQSFRLVDHELEDAIDDAGRNEVFALAEANGWSASNPPPKSLWWEIVRQVRARKTSD